MNSNSASSSMEPSKTRIVKEFTEKWLQALSLSAAHPAAQRIKPLLNDIDSICMQRSEQEHMQAAARLWDYGDSAGLRELLTATPYVRGEWRFDDEDTFVLERTRTNSPHSLEDWLQNLGLRQHQLPVTAIINQDDWSELIRIEAIRLGRPLKVIGSPPAKESLLWLNGTAEWDRADWTIRFDDPSWVVKRFEGSFVVSRPQWSELEKTVFEAIAFAVKHLSKGPTTTTPAKFDEQPWMQSIPSLMPLHRTIISNQSSMPSAWFYRVWMSVWPVIYREQNRLRGACDIEVIRRELELGFRNVPQLVIWTFALGKLICQHQLGRGLGICGEFK